MGQAFLTAPSENHSSSKERVISQENGFLVWDGYWLLPLRTKSGDVVTGILGLAAHPSRAHVDLNDTERAGLEAP